MEEKFEDFGMEFCWDRGYAVRMNENEKEDFVGCQVFEDVARRLTTDIRSNRVQIRHYDFYSVQRS